MLNNPSSKLPPDSHAVPPRPQPKANAMLERSNCVSALKIKGAHTTLPSFTPNSTKTVWKPYMAYNIYTRFSWQDGCEALVKTDAPYLCLHLLQKMQGVELDAGRLALEVGLRLLPVVHHASVAPVREPVRLVASNVGGCQTVKQRLRVATHIGTCNCAKVLQGSFMTF